MSNTAKKNEIATHNEPDNFIAVVERLATNPDVDPGKLEHLLNLQERILDRNALTAFNASFAQMQANLPVITEHGKIEVNSQVRSTYARFEDINDAVKPILQEYGFAVSFKTDTKDATISVTGILMHREGHRETTTLNLGADTSGSKNSVQAIGSSVSYAKRYVLCAMLNITTRGEDDDGGKGGLSRLNDEEAANVNALLDEVGRDKWQVKFLKHMKVNKVEDIPRQAYKDAIASLEKKRAQ